MVLDVSKLSFRDEAVGGVKQTRVRTQKGVHIKRTCAYKGEGGSNFSHFGAYVLIE